MIAPDQGEKLSKLPPGVQVNEPARSGKRENVIFL
jgi:hypothetical protein